MLVALRTTHGQLYACGIDSVTVAWRLPPITTQEFSFNNTYTDEICVLSSGTTLQVQYTQSPTTPT